MKVKIISLALILMLLLSGCSGLAGNVDELLSPPRLTLQQSRITDLLDEHVGSAVRLKYPRRGEFLSPFVTSDLDGDGINEIVVFYSDESTSRNVHLAVFSLQKDEYVLTSESEGLGTEIEAISISDLYGNGSPSLIVGYTSTNLSDKYLAIYNYKDQTLQKLYDQGYSEYVLADFTGNATNDLVVLSPATQPGPIEASLLTVQNGTLATIYSVTLDVRLQSCIALSATPAGDGTNALVIDGTLAGGAYASEVLRCENKKFVSYSFELGSDIVNLTKRDTPLLKSRDADNDGIVECPVVLGTIKDGAGNARWLWVSYYDFTNIETFENNFVQTTKFPRTIVSALPNTLPKPTPTPTPSTTPQPTATPEPSNEKVFGVVDIAYNCFVPLPVGWKNNVALRSLAGDDWCIVKKGDEESKLLIMQMVAKEDTLADNILVYGKREEYKQVGTSAGSRIYARILGGGGANPTAVLNNITVLG